MLGSRPTRLNYTLPTDGRLLSMMYQEVCLSLLYSSNKCHSFFFMISSMGGRQSSPSSLLVAKRKKQKKNSRGRTGRPSSEGAPKAPISCACDSVPFLYTYECVSSREKKKKKKREAIFRYGLWPDP